MECSVNRAALAPTIKIIIARLWIACAQVRRIVLNHKELGLYNPVIQQRRSWAKLSGPYTRSSPVPLDLPSILMQPIKQGPSDIPRRDGRPIRPYFPVCRVRRKRLEAAPGLYSSVHILLDLMLRDQDGEDADAPKPPRSDSHSTSRAISLPVRHSSSAPTILLDSN